MWGRHKKIAVGGIAVLLILVLLSLTGFSTVPTIILGGGENASPSDWVKPEQINVYQDKVILAIPHAFWASFTNTNSMDPFLDEDAHAIEVLPESPDKINVGDVIAYRAKDGVIIHRVIAQGEDAEGAYYVVKGDNNRFGDPLKVRFEDVQGVVVAVVY